MENKVYDIAIIGAGASGLMASCAAGEGKEKPRLLLLEGQKKAGRRLLATGNGRCNLSNRYAAPEKYHGDTEKIASLLERYSPKAVEGIFRKWGLLCREESEGRMYPYSLQASSVLSLLLGKAQENGASILCEKKVSSVTGQKGSFRIACDKESFEAKRIVFASGGLSYPSLGGNSSGWEILQFLGHSVTPAFPSLVQLLTEKKFVSSLKGARCRGRVTLYLDKEPTASSEGEIQFTDKGLSGICVFEISRIYGEYAQKGGRNAELSCDLMPAYSLKDISSYLRERVRSRDLPVEELLDGALQYQVGRNLLRRTLPGKVRVCGELRGEEIAAVAREIKDFRFPVIGSAGWETAQVTAGGIPLREINLQTMESRRCPGVYLAGELLNIDGDCGGYNLHWAWATGHLAGISAAADWRKDHGGI